MNWPASALTFRRLRLRRRRLGRLNESDFVTHAPAELSLAGDGTS